MAEEWKRDTPWRQGHLLPPEALSLLRNTEPDDFAVVITYDCDLASDILDTSDPRAEPFVEVLLGKKGDTSKTAERGWGKNPRLIHLNYKNPQGKTLVLEFAILDRKNVAKAELCKFEPQKCELPSAELEAFSRWLASRYRRSAFPDAFNDALAASKLGKKLEKRLKGSGGEAVTAVLFDIVERSATEFNLSVVLLYLDEDRHGEVEAIEADIKELFKDLNLEVSGDGAKIVLGDCTSISEGEITLRQARRLQKWEKDYLSFRSDPPDEMLDET